MTESAHHLTIRPDQGRLATAQGSGLEELMRRPLSDEDLDRATAELAAPLEARSRARQSLLVFRRGGELLAVPAAEAAKVVPPQRPHRVPHRSNAIFRGIVNHDGEILLCTALEAALDLPAADSPPQAKLVVVGTARDRWAFEVDAVEGVVDVAQTAMRDAPVTVTAARSGCARRLARVPMGEAAVLELPLLFAIFRGAVG
ncbi:MAG: chemotaxis protein CheW [Phycisphaerales bacterium]